MKDEGDVVCVGIVPRGQTVDWEPGQLEPDPAEWLTENLFMDVLDACRRHRVPVFHALDIYRQTRIDPAQCKRVLAHWGLVETALTDSAAEEHARCIRRMMELCAKSNEDVELLIEGP